MKKIPKINKPISLTSKNIARIYTDLVRRNANTIRSQNRMSGGLNEAQINEFQGFLTEYAETVGKLKYILLDKLCEHTIDMITAKNTIEYDNDRYILEKINKSFTDNPELYKYNIPAIEHTDPDINFLINALKLVSSFNSSVRKTPGLEEVNSTYTFDTRYIPTKLLNIVDMKDFEKEYREIQKKRDIIHVLTPPSPPPLPVKETPEEARKRLLRDSLILSRKIVVSPVEKRLQKRNNMQKIAYLETIQEEDEEDDLSGGRKPTKYKSTGNAVFIMYKKKKYKRTIYVKDKRKTKYCKINNEYILLNKLKIIE